MATKRINPKIYLAEWRKIRGVSQRQLAWLSGVSHATIAVLESGDAVKHRPYPATINALANALDVTPRELWSAPTSN